MYFNIISDSLNTADTSENEALLLNISLSDRFHPLINQNLKTDVSLKRSRKLADVFLNTLLPKNDREYQNFLKKDNSEKFDDKFTESDTPTYEVVENVTVEDNIIPGEFEVKENGYEYNPPTKKNFTNDLIKHLSKYNIRDVDDLQNYALSRHPKAASPVTKDHPHKRVHFRVPIRYNSLNHLPVDPLLAVFLSNYGHYLQGQYGIQNNYNNLYGYLASNNVHNNRPFGLYKLFSDTDSSNR